MKILLTTDAYDTMINGVAVSVRNLSSALTAAGNDVRILTLSQTHRSYIEDNVYYIKSVPLKIYPDARATVSFNNPLLMDIIDWSPEIIHSQCEFFTFIFAKKLAKHLNIPIVHTYHTLYEYYTHYFCPNKALGKKIVSAGTRFICNQAHAVIAPTEKTKDILLSYGIDSPISVIPTGLSLDKLQKTVDENQQASLKKQLNIPENVPVLITLGRLAREKNIDFLIEQMVSPEIKNLNVHLVIAGDGPDRNRLETLTSSLGLCDTIHFTGMIAPEDVYRYYHLGSIFVSASSSETQGLTYIEAMACGLPILCLKDACLKSILKSGKNGWFFENTGDFSNHLAAFFSNPELASKMKAYAQSSAKHFSKETFANRAEKLYKDVIFQYSAAPALHYLLPRLSYIHQQKH